MLCAKIQGDGGFFAKEGDDAPRQIALYRGFFPVVGQQVCKQTGRIESSPRDVLCSRILATFDQCHL